MAKLSENEVLVKTIKSYKDKYTGKTYLVKAKNLIRKVTKERAEELINAGVCELYNNEN